VSATPLQIVLCFALLIGLAAGCSALAMASLARFLPRRRLLALVAAGGFAVFCISMLVLTHPGERLMNAYFWLFTIAVVGGGLGTVTMRNVFHSALMLTLALIGVGGYFILTNAEFLAMVQMILYIGGIMVLFLFGIMVSQNIIGTELKQHSPQAPWAALAAGAMFLFLAFTGLFMSVGTSDSAGRSVIPNNTQSVGWSLMATYTLPFEVASMLLLMALIGAIVLVRKEDD
jgi:NADH-quinone oxidoreductase subunit J